VALDGVTLAERQADAAEWEVNKFSKFLYIVNLSSKYTWALTFENLCQVDGGDALHTGGTPREGWKEEGQGEGRSAWVGDWDEEGDGCAGEGSCRDCGEHVGSGTSEDEAGGGARGLSWWSRQVKVHVVTEDEAEAGKFAISDVVVPRGGHGLSAEVLATPAGKMLERYLWYDELDLAQGLEVELCQQTTDQEGWYPVTCAFRRLISRPSDVAMHFPPALEAEAQTQLETEAQTQGGGGHCPRVLATASSPASKGHGHEDEDHQDEDQVASSSSTNLSSPPSPSSELNVSSPSMERTLARPPPQSICPCVCSSFSIIYIYIYFFPFLAHIPRPFLPRISAASPGRTHDMDVMRPTKKARRKRWRRGGVMMRELGCPLPPAEEAVGSGQWAGRCVPGHQCRKCACGAYSLTCA